MRHKAEYLRKELNRPEFRSCYDHAGPPQSPLTVLVSRIVRPLKMTTMTVITPLISLYLAVAYGTSYILLTTH